MVDPYAPPQEGASRPPRPSAQPEVYPPGRPAATGQVYQQTYEAPPTFEDRERERDRFRDRPGRRDRDHDREARTEPAKLGLFWTIAAVGVGLLCLGRLLLYFAVADAIPGDEAAGALFGTLGLITVAVGLCLAAVLQRGLALPWRIALLLGAAFFAAVPGSVPAVGFGGLI